MNQPPQLRGEPPLQPIDKIKEETRYITTDGKAHKTGEEALVHQLKLDFFAWCDTNICHGGEWSSRMVAQEIWQHWDVSQRLKPRAWDE